MRADRKTQSRHAWRRSVAGIAAALAAPMAASLIVSVPASAATVLSLTGGQNWWVDPAVNGLHIIGEVSNGPLGDSARFVRVACTLYDVSGAVLATETASTDADVILAGEKSPFDDLFVSAPKWDHFGCALTGGTSTTVVANHNFTSAITSISTDSDSGAQLVHGTVTNLNDAAALDIRAIVTFYDSSMKVLDEDAALVNPNTPLAHNASTDFTITRFPAAKPTLGQPIWDGVNAAVLAEAPSPAVGMPVNLPFGSQIVGTTSGPQTVTVTNVGTADLHVPANAWTIGGVNPGDFAIATDGCSSGTVAAGFSCTATLTFTPTLFGNRAATLSLHDDANGAPQSMALAGNGLSRAAVGNTPAVSFGSVLVNATASLPVTISSAGLPGGDLVITGLGIDDTSHYQLTDHGCLNADLPPATSCAPTIAFTPDSANPFPATLTVTGTDAKGNPARNSPLLVPLSGTGTARASAASVSGGPVVFDPQVLNTPSASQSVTLTSTGTQPLLVSGVSASGDFQVLNQCPKSMDPTTACTIGLTFTPTGPGPRAGTLTITDNAAPGMQTVALSGSGRTQTVFYFAEGFTGTGFTESLSILMPSQSGTAQIDYYTGTGHVGPVFVPVTAGQVVTRDVSLDVGAGQEVSAKVTLNGRGVAERVMHFNADGWHGSTDIVGVAQPSSEWDFAEGSTYSAYSEFLTLQNPNASTVTASLHYFTDGGAHPVKTVTLPANSRTTVLVFGGSLSGGACIAGAAGDCGVGPGIGGVSVQVLSTGPIIAERPFYVNGFSFGSGVIRDGHVAFGAPAAGTTWNFAEGTTIHGFNEFLTIADPGLTPAPVTLRYVDNLGTVTTKTLTINPQSRSTVLVFGSAQGVGVGVLGVSVQVTSTDNVPIVVERPMYLVQDFGSGVVAGADDALGATGFGTLFGFAQASTASKENDYLTIQNPNPAATTIGITYYTGTGVIARAFTVPANTRHTVLIFAVTNPQTADQDGAGPGFAQLGIVVTSTLPVLVEKPTYGADPSSYGATDTLGYSPTTFTDG